MTNPLRSKILLGAFLTVALVGTGVALSRTGQSQSAAEHYDVLIRGGRLLDGTAVPWRYADVAIRADRIVEVGDIPENATADMVVDVPCGSFGLTAWGIVRIVADPVETWGYLGDGPKKAKAARDGREGDR